MKKTANIYHVDSESNHNNPESQNSKNNAANPAQSLDSNDEIQQRRDAIDDKVAKMQTEYGGRPKEKGLEPTRYNDWEFKGRCIDF